LMKEYNLLWLSGYIFSFLLINNSTAIFQVQHNFTMYSFLLLLMNVLLIFFLIIVLSGILSKAVISESVNEDELSSNYSIKANFLVVFIQAILLVGYSWRNITRPRFQLPDFFEVKLILKYAVLSLSTNIVFFLVYRVDYWFINYFWQDKDLGNYIQVSKLVQIFMVFPTFLGTIIFPTSAKGDVKQLNEKLAALSRVIFTSYVIILTILFVVGKVLFPFLYGESFSGMYMPFILLIPGILALSIHSLITAYYAGKNKVIVNLKGALLALLFILVLDYLLIPIFGNSGAAIASSVGYLVYAIFMFYIFHKDQQLSFLQFLLIKKGDWYWLKQRILNNKG
ncbi:MAG: polysaccharide biosynthesis C-terminal domain-containing protein, partial [Chitinophagaceae bacterium]